MKTFVRLLAFVKPFWKGVLLSIFTSAATVGSSIGLLGTSAYLISFAALQPSIAYLQVAIVGVRFFGLARGLFRYLERLSSHSVNFRLLARLRVWFYCELEPLAPARLMNYRGGDLLQRAVGDIEVLENFYIRVIAPPLAALLVTLGAGWLMTGWHPELASVLAGGLLLGGIAVPWLAHRISQAPGRGLAAARAQMSATYIESLQGLADLLAYGQESALRDRMSQSESRLAAVQMRLAWSGGVGNALGQLVGNLTLVAILLVAIPLVRAGQLDGVLLAVVSLVTLASFEAVAPLPQAAQMLEASLESARRLFELVDAQPAVLEPASPLPPPAGSELRVRNLTHRYTAAQPPALQGLDLDLPPGRKVALVGHSGAGKSTLQALLMRFWDAPADAIILDNQDIRDYRSEDARRVFAFVPQSTYLFTSTLRQNLHLARPDAPDQDLHAVLEQAGLRDWLEQLPNGLDTWLGERGQQMSGGECQRLAVARALLYDAPVVLLDEPTAHLDAITEQELIDTLHRVLAGKTVLWASHSLTGMQWMDEIVVLESGRAVERGTHAQLIKKGGLYATMYRIQHDELIADL